MNLVKYLISLYLFIIPNLDILAQSNEVKAKAFLLKAQEQYGEGNYSNAVSNLLEVKEILGATNPRVQAMLTKAYVKDGKFLDAKNAQATYFDLADESDPDFQEMVKLVDLIDEGAKKEQAGLDDQNLRKSDGYELKYRVKAGEKYVYKVINAADMLGGLVTYLSDFTRYSVEVIDVQENEIDLRITLLDGLNMPYASNNKYVKEKSIQQANELSKNCSFEMTIDPYGAIVSVRSQKMIDELTDKFSKFKKMEKMSFNQQLDLYKQDSRTFNVLESYFIIFPKKKILVGEEWTYKTGPEPYQIPNTYKLDSVEGEKITLSNYVTIDRETGMILTIASQDGKIYRELITD